MSDDSLRVPKQTVPVRVRLRGGVEWDGELFLSFCSPLHEGPQGLVEFLNEAAAFIPIRAAGAEIRLIGKAEIISVSASLETLARSGASPASPLSARGSFHLVDGSAVAGDVDLAECASAQPRLLDALNSPSRFLSLTSDRELIALGKAAVRWVVPDEGSRSKPNRNPMEMPSHV
jgi:hypothetical protein